MGKFLGRLIGFTVLDATIILLVSYFVGTDWINTAINFALNLIKV